MLACFCSGRQILNAALIEQEIIDNLLESGEDGVLRNLDTEKAYDHVAWSFLF